VIKPRIRETGNVVCTGEMHREPVGERPFVRHRNRHKEHTCMDISGNVD
jgi:hypothetical protein